MRQPSTEVDRFLIANGFILVRSSKHRIYERSGIRHAVHQGSKPHSNEMAFAKGAVRRAERAEAAVHG